MMRKTLRIFVSGIWAIAFVLFALTLETVADALGWTSTVKTVVTKGWRDMSDAGYSDIVAYFFFLMTGVFATVWGEYGLRKFDARKRKENWAHFTVSIVDSFHTGKKLIGVDDITVIDGPIRGNIYQSDPKISKNALALIIQFDCEIIDTCPYVCADRKIIWREISSGPHYLILEIDMVSKEDVTFGVIVRPLEWMGGNKRDTEFRWHDASVLPRETVLRDRDALKKRRWPLGIGQKTPL